MKRPVQWSRDALDDLTSQLAYIAADNPVAFADQIRKTGASLGEMTTGRPGRIGGTYEKLVARLPYIIAYAVTKEAGREVVSIFADAVPTARRRKRLSPRRRARSTNGLRKRVDWAGNRRLRRATRWRDRLAARGGPRDMAELILRIGRRGLIFCVFIQTSQKNGPSLPRAVATTIRAKGDGAHANKHLKKSWPKFRRALLMGAANASRPYLIILTVWPTLV